MDSRIAVMGIILEEPQSVAKLNELLHDYADYIIGRMGIPYRDKKLSVLSIVIDASQDVTSALTGKIGKLPGVTVKTAYAKTLSE